MRLPVHPFRPIPNLNEIKIANAEYFLFLPGHKKKHPTLSHHIYHIHQAIQLSNHPQLLLPRTTATAVFAMIHTYLPSIFQMNLYLSIYTNYLYRQGCE